MEYFTVYTRIPTVGTNVDSPQDVTALIQQFGGSANGLNLNPPQGGWTSLLEFYVTSGLSIDIMMKIEGYLVCTNATNALVNINTASQEVLSCIPGIGLDYGPQLVAYRQTNPTLRNTIAWLPQALGWTAQNNMTDIRKVGPWICGRAYQFSADIAAVGHHGRGYKRVKYVFDVADGYAQTRLREDLTYLGWALGKQVRDSISLASNTR
jgi:type II secretory pathway component PulK